MLNAKRLGDLLNRISKPIPDTFEPLGYLPYQITESERVFLKECPEQLYEWGSELPDFERKEFRGYVVTVLDNLIKEMDSPVPWSTGRLRKLYDGMNKVASFLCRSYSMYEFNYPVPFWPFRKDKSDTLLLTENQYYVIQFWTDNVGVTNPAAIASAIEEYLKVGRSEWRQWAMPDITNRLITHTDACGISPDEVRSFGTYAKWLKRQSSKNSPKQEYDDNKYELKLCGKESRRDLWQIQFGDEKGVFTSKFLKTFSEVLKSPEKELCTTDIDTNLKAKLLEQRTNHQVVDPEALRAYKKRLKDIDEELDQAESNNDEAWRERLEKEREDITHQVRDITRPRGDGKAPDIRMLDSVNKIVKSSKGAIDKQKQRLLKRLRESDCKMLSFADHLDVSVKWTHNSTTGLPSLIYTASPRISWEFSA